LKDVAVRLGYRFSIRSLKVQNNVVFKRDGNRPIAFEIELVNDGIAPCYKNYEILLNIIDQHGSSLYSDKFRPEPSTTKWYPNVPIILKRDIRLPQFIDPGKYLLSMEILDERNGDKSVQIDVGKKDKSGRYTIAKINVGLVEPNAVSVSFFRVE
jgi:hypothetical protein